ncbi:hypothetical protein PS910_00051 [Pseudomonas fluorescens]|nr:hypothetical protein PS910_00051 [Pseudomonas fluorescens]
MLFKKRLKPSVRYNLPLLFAGLLIAASPLCSFAANPQAAGSITLTGKKGDPQDPDNTATGTCTLNLPERGRTVDLSIANPASACYDIRVETVAMSNLPAATQILFTDDHLCGTALGNSYHARRDPTDNQNFWIRIKTTEPNATLVEESLAALTGKNKFVTNTAPNGTRSKGLMVVDSAQTGDGSRITWNLSCVQIKVSADTSTVRGAPINVASTDWDEGRDEHKSKDFMCPAGTVMTGRKHGNDDKADEKAPTYYKCAKLPNDITREDSTWSIGFPECGYRLKEDDDDDFMTCTDAVNYNKDMQRYIHFSCPVDEVMVGRSHEGDENEHSQYRCAALYKGDAVQANRVIVEPGAWSGDIQESGDDKKGSEHTCPTDQVMVGRAHAGDENGNTRYQCAVLRAPR